jgi:hypothetical protein
VVESLDLQKIRTLTGVRIFVGAYFAALEV